MDIHKRALQHVYTVGLLCVYYVEKRQMLNFSLVEINSGI